MHPSMHPSMHPCIHPCIHASIHASMHPSMHACMHPSLPFIHSFIHSFIQSFIQSFINLSLSSGVFSDRWKVARVAPIFKEGLSDDRLNYWPISVLPAASRLFEKLVYDQLYRYLDENKLKCLQQSGFRSLHSIVTCLLKCMDDWSINIDKGKFTAMILIDLKKAFDTVDHGNF